MNAVTREQVVGVIGSLDTWSDRPREYRFKPAGSITFHMLNQLSELFGTDRIDYSDSCGELVVYKDVPQ